jgi:hypothetical protein
MMTTGDILYYVLLGVVLVFAADMFRLWDPWARALTRVLDRVGIRLNEKGGR